MQIGILPPYTYVENGFDPARTELGSHRVTALKIDLKSEKGVFRRGHQKAGTAGFTPHTKIDTSRLAVDEITRI
jgi:hypothetical protein